MRTLRTRVVPNLRRRAGLAAAVVAFAIPLIWQPVELSDAGTRMFAIFLLAIVLWVTEAIPLYATATVVILLEILLLSDKALIGLDAGFETPPYADFFAALAHPVLILFLGGAFLAAGSVKFKLDRALASTLLRPFGEDPKRLMLGLMLITAVFSMFMSNTATTATMLAVVLPVVAQLEPGDRLRTGLVLSIPVAANIGGIGTPVGTPPNAIAVGQLASAGIDVSFAKWMLLALPGVVVVLGIAWFVLVRFFPATATSVSIESDVEFDRSRPAYIFYGTFALTVVLWLTEPIHGLASGIVGFVPIVVLLSTGVFDADDLKRAQWDILWLVGGGIALGAGVAISGFDTWLVSLIEWDSFGSVALVGLLALVAIVMSTVISNSAAANLLVPIGLSLALSGAADLDPLFAGFFIAIGASLAMALPVSTPTNAVAYSTGMISTRDMARTGIVVGIAGLGVFMFSPLLWSGLGIA